MYKHQNQCQSKYRAICSRLLITLGLLLTSYAFAVEDSQRRYLELSPATKMDLEILLNTLEESIEEVAGAEEPVVIVLHGREASAFTNMNYLENKNLVDRAARLDASDLIDVRMCATWMRRNDIELSDIPSFIDTVPFAPEEIRRLKREGYQKVVPINI